MQQESDIEEVIDADENQDVGEEDDEEMIEIDEDQLRQLLIQHQRNLEGQDGGEPIYDEDGNPIELN